MDLGERLTSQLQLGLLLALGLWVATAIMLPLTFGIDPTAVAVAVALPAGVVVAGMLAMTWAHSWRAQQVVNGVVNLVGGMMMIDIATNVADVPAQLTAALAVNAIFAFSVVRMGPILGLAAELPPLLWLGGLAWAGSVPEISWFSVFLVSAAVGVAAFGAYMLEASSRARFLQRRTLNLQSQALVREMAKSDRLLHNMLPGTVADRLREGPVLIADAVGEASVVFADIVGFTAIGSSMAPDALVSLLNALFGRFDELAESHGLEKIKTIGDGYLAVAGAPVAVDDHAMRAVRFGLAIVDAAHELGGERGLPLQVRVGVHSGPLVAGVIGHDKLAYDLWGDTVNVASRMESHGVAGRVQVTEATARLLDADVPLEARGTIELRNRGPMPVLLVGRVEG